MSDATEHEHLDPEDRAAIRAYLQRSEVRLSTVHRVASALLSGAGLMVLLPAIERDAVVVVLRALLTGPLSAVDGLLIVGVLASVAVPFVALALLLRDLTTFYFHANHLDGTDGRDVFTPRFTLTGLRLPSDDLSPEAAAQLAVARVDPKSVELLVPDNDVTRAAIDRRTAAHSITSAENTGDVARAEALFAFAASHPRPLVEEVAKVEHGMTRHVLGIQVIVLRYAKALLALLATALAAFSAAAVLEGRPVIDTGMEVWLSGILLAWAPLAVLAVSTPVRWLENRLRSEGATHTAVAKDHEMTAVERATIALAVVGFVAAFVAMVSLLTTEHPTASTSRVGVAVTILATAAMTTTLASWLRRTRTS